MHAWKLCGGNRDLEIPMEGHHKRKLERIAALAHEWATIVIQVSEPARTDKQLLWNLEDTITEASKEIKAPNEWVLQRAGEERSRDRLLAAARRRRAASRADPSVVAAWIVISMSFAILAVLIWIRLFVS